EGVSRGGVWGNVVKIGEEIDALGVEFTSSCVGILGDGRDIRWSLGEDGEFNVKELSRMIKENTLLSDIGGQETFWNKLVPKKVNIFMWRALKGRLPVRVELDKRGVDLDSVLCPSCSWEIFSLVGLLHPNVSF
nr:RNA-directed DNA polymerase, eukaryota, reverse transcriptase zinc-binding domain protein [Tanacetum cinerariifolium]